MKQAETIKVWDLAVRTFHGLLALTFTLAYLSEDEYLNLHTTTGYTVIGLIAFRLLWGFIGTTHARFRNFVRPPAEVIGYIKRIASGTAEATLGHNPAGGAMIVALLIALAATTLSGVALYGAVEFSGPLATLGFTLSHASATLIEESHELCANLTLLLIALHIVGVVVASLQHRENLPLAMITGNKHYPINSTQPGEQ